jgi:hypothetical protein
LGGARGKTYTMLSIPDEEINQENKKIWAVGKFFHSMSLRLTS